MKVACRANPGQAGADDEHIEMFDRSVAL